MKQPNNDPDLIIIGQPCHTLTATKHAVEALATKRGRIIACGGRGSVLSLRRRGTRVLDLRPAAITPGLVDCHTHFLYWALNHALGIDLSDLASLDAVLRRIHTQGRKRRVGDWIVARGFDHNRWGIDFPTAADLDNAVPDHPVMVRGRDGHSTWLNTAGMRRVGITRRTPDPKGGRYLRDHRGQPTGIVQEAALEALPDPLRDLAQRTDAAARRIVDRALEAAYRTAWSLGVVGVHSMDDGPSLAHLQRHHGERRLGLRVVHAVAHHDLPNARQIGLRSGLGDQWLRIGGVKIFADGALGSQTAYMFEPYPGRGRFCGVSVTAGSELKETVRDAVAHGWAAWIHAIGDRAVHEAASAIIAARRCGTPALPHRIEHVQCVRPGDVRRMARAGIVASVQPCHLLGDITTADRHWPRARRNTYAFRRLLDSGVTLACGSDVPIESIDPRRSLFGATVRTNEHGDPPGGWFPRQKISTADVLRAFTVGAAVAAGRPESAGTITPGAPADLTIWQEDPLRAAPETLLQVGILGCVIDGQVHLAEKT